jgi:hypothetical protein
MRNLALASLLLVLSGCIPTIDQRKLEPVPAGERVNVAAPLKVIENRRLVKLEWHLHPGSYVERFSTPSGRVFLSERNLVQSTTTLGEKAMHAGGFIIPKDKPGMATLYIVRGSSGQKLATDALIVRLAAGVESDLTLIADFKLSDLKRR